MDLSKKIVCVVDRNWSGASNPTYHLTLVKAYLELGCKVVSLSPNPNYVNAYFSSQQSFFSKDNLLCYAFPIVLQESSQAFSEESLQPAVKTKWTERTIQVGKRLINFLKYVPFVRLMFVLYIWKILASVLKKIEEENEFVVDFVFFSAMGDYLGSFMSPVLFERVFPYRWSGVCVHTDHVIKKPFIWQAFKSRYCLGVSILNEFHKPVFQQKLLNKQIYIFPDITDEQAPNPQNPQAQEILKKAQSRKIIGLFGALARRKNLLTMCRLIEIARTHYPNWFFVVAGFIESEGDFSIQELDYIYHILKEPSENTIVYLKRLHDGEEFNSIIGQSNIIYAAYNNFPHSSNMLTKSALLQIPIIVNDGELMAFRVCQHKTGAVITPGHHVKELAEAIQTLLNDFENNPQPYYSGFEQYYGLHSFERLKSTLKEMLISDLTQMSYT